jgi:site-specific DNA recombinase
MKKVFGYIRVSTVKQGTGVSLQEQKEAIIRYAEKHQLNIIEWFEEQETAAKQGRPLFTKMMKLIRAGKSNGVIIHKIDRSARNLRDWASLGDLIDQGFDIHFAHESLDMDTRGGRLAADIQAVIASDYIRNLRDETLKGLYGRLKQGIYPFGAPIGYLDNGGGKLKTLDVNQGPLVKQAFQLYATNKYNLESLTKTMQELGLKNTKGNPISLTTLAKILNNAFYAGVLKVKGKTFQGIHVPLISSALFSQVQDILQGKTNTRIIKHDFIFRRLVKCAGCGYSLIAETQKGNVYYRCHIKECSTKTIREVRIKKKIIKSFKHVQIHPIENQILNELLLEAQNNWSESQQGIKESLIMQQGLLIQKRERLVEAFLENVIDNVQFEEKKEKLLIEEQGLKQKIEQLSYQKEMIFKKTKKFLELAKSLRKSFINANTDEKRKIMKNATSNLTIEGRKLMFTMKSPYYDMAKRYDLLTCDLDRGIPRNCTVQFAKGNKFSDMTVDNPELRERMKKLLEIILNCFELQEDNEEDESL